MIPNGKEMNWNGHHLVFESTTYQCRGCFFENMGSCPDCDEGIWVEDGTEGRGERDMAGWQTGIPTKDGLYVIKIHPYGSMNRDPAYACYYIKNGVLKDCLDTDPIEPKSFWKDYAIKWMKISY